MAKQRRSPRHQNPNARGKSLRPDAIQSPLAYLEQRRGSDVAQQVVEKAKITVASLNPLREPVRLSLTTKERRHGLMLAKELLPYVRHLPPLAQLLDMVIRSWEGRPTPRPGRRSEKKALFVGSMMAWAAVSHLKPDLFRNEDYQLLDVDLLRPSAEVVAIGQKEAENGTVGYAVVTRAAAESSSSGVSR